MTTIFVALILCELGHLERLVRKHSLGSKIDCCVGFALLLAAASGYVDENCGPSLVALSVGGLLYSLQFMLVPSLFLQLDNSIVDTTHKTLVRACGAGLLGFSAIAAGALNINDASTVFFVAITLAISAYLIIGVNRLLQRPTLKAWVDQSAMGSIFLALLCSADQFIL